MIRRRAGRPGLLGTMARTAVVTGTATAVHGSMQRQAAERSAEARQQALAQEAAFQAQAELAQLRQEQATPPPAPAAAPAPAPAPAGGGGDLLAELERLAALRTAGVLTDVEFTAAKAKLLGL